jgi:hypothetical protein
VSRGFPGPTRAYEAIRMPFCRGTKSLMDRDDDSNFHKARGRRASEDGTACPDVDGNRSCYLVASSKNLRSARCACPRRKPFIVNETRHGRDKTNGPREYVDWRRVRRCRVTVPMPIYLIQTKAFAACHYRELSTCGSSRNAECAASKRSVPFRQETFTISKY